MALMRHTCMSVLRTYLQLREPLSGRRQTRSKNCAWQTIGHLS